MTETLPVASTPDWFDPKAIIADFIDGKASKDIAKSLDIPVSKLYYYLTSRAPENWKEAVTIRAIQRSIEAEDEIDAAADAHALRKAEAKLRSAQWNLERVCRPIYGQDAPKDEGRKVNITLNLSPVFPGEGVRVINPEGSSKL